MSIYYNDILNYNQPFINYSGALILDVPSISSPIILSNINIVFVEKIDNNNLTYIGVIAIDTAPNGVINFINLDEQGFANAQASIDQQSSSEVLVLQASEEQAQKIAEATTIYIVGPGSGTTVSAYIV